MKARFLIILLCFVTLFVSGCSPVYIKYVSNNETFVITKDDVKSVNGKANIQNELYVTMEFTEKGRTDFSLMTERNAGKFVSIYFGNKLLWADLYLPKPMDSREMNITMPDEKTMQEVVKI